MTRLELPGYRVVVPSSVYSTNNIIHSSGDPGESIIVAERYIESSREDIEERIRDLTERMLKSDGLDLLYSNSRRKESFEGNDEILTLQLSLFPYNILRAISKGDDSVLERLRVSIDPKVKKRGSINSTNIYVRHGIVPINQLTLYRQKNSQETHEWYHELMPYEPAEEHAIDECWGFIIPVIDKKWLTPRNTLDMILQCNAAESDAIYFTGLRTANRDRVAAVLDAVYSLVESEKLSILPDVSDREFLEMCVSTLETLEKPLEKGEKIESKFTPIQTSRE